MLALVAVLWPVPCSSAWLTLTSAQGLAGSKVTAVGEDQAGRLWFADYWRGISRYDGAEWAHFRGNACRCDSIVHAICVDRSGNVWFGTNRTGAVRYDGANWESFTTRGTGSPLPSDEVRVIYEDRGGHLWFGTAPHGGVPGGVARYDPVGNAWTRLPLPLKYSQYAFQAIFEDRLGNLWFGMEDGGVLRYDPSTGDHDSYTTANGLMSNDVRGIAQDSYGILWFATSGGLSRYDGSGWTTLTAPDALPGNSNNGTAVIVDSRGSLWFGLDDGVARLSGGTWSMYTTSDGLGSNRILSIYEDHSGYVWFGTDGGGVSRFHEGDRWTVYTMASTGSGLPRDNIVAMHSDRSGYLWFAAFQAGVTRYNGSDWRTYRVEDGLASDQLRVIGEDRLGNLWFGTLGLGASRFQPASGIWSTFTADSGLAGNDVTAIAEDRSGGLWFGTNAGVSRYDPGSGAWDRTTNAGLLSTRIAAVVEDRSLHIWAGTYGGGLSRYDGAVWAAPTTDGGLPGENVVSVREDPEGHIWAGTDGGGVGRYDPASGVWTRFTQVSTRDSLPSDWVTAISIDRRGNVWVATGGGVSRFDGELWKPSAAAILRGMRVNAILEDGLGAVWFATTQGVRQYQPDEIPPNTVFRGAPPPLSSTRSLTSAASVPFDGARGHDFSFRLDGLAGDQWSPWSPDSTWTNFKPIEDGDHVLEARSRDSAGNVDATPARTQFQVDATPPSPRIASPTVGQSVRDSVLILGTVDDSRLKEYRVEVRPFDSPSWTGPDVDTLTRSTTPVDNDTLAVWRTLGYPDGYYELRASAVDLLGLEGNYPVSVVVDNHAPWVDQTAPNTVSAASGGDLYTGDGAVHLYFPPRGFDRDATVEIKPLSEPEVGDSLNWEERVRVSPFYKVSWGSATLRKPATLALSIGGASPEGQGVLAIYVSSADDAWSRAGGTVDARAMRIALPMTEQGRYALYRDQGGSPSADLRLSRLSLTPRVFSPRGTYGDRRVGIGFTLGRAGPVTVKVYSRAGRLMREVALGVGMGAGANVVWWDGRDRDGAIVNDGLYYVVVKAQGDVQTKAIAVVK